VVVVKRRPARTVVELCIARGGVMKGARVQAFIAQWTMASQALGKPITLEEYREWWRVSHGSAYREQARFRELFPELATPQPIADVAIARAEEWVSRGVAGFGQLPASVVPA
jgi:hypothetical protein